MTNKILDAAREAGQYADAEYRRAWEEVPIGRIAAKLLDRPPFTVGPNEGSTLFSKLCRQLLIEGLTFHDTRGSALTWLSKKVDVMVLARISRHRDLQILMDHYYRVTPSEIAQRI